MRSNNCVKARKGRADNDVILKILKHLRMVMSVTHLEDKLSEMIRVLVIE